jgi:hypothetical protein
MVAKNGEEAAIARVTQPATVGSLEDSSVRVNGDRQGSG